MSTTCREGTAPCEEGDAMGASWRHAEIRTLPDIVRYWGARTPRKVALSNAGRTLTYGQLDARSSLIGSAVVASGLPLGSHLGYLGKNTIEFWELWFGATKAGCAIAPVNWRSAVPELVALVDDARMPLVFVQEEFGDVARQVREAVRDPFEIVIVGGAEDAPKGLARWIEGRASADPRVFVDGTATALLNYTSGTTGKPKGVVWSHQAFNYYFLMASLEPTDSWRDDDTILMVMPNFHLAGTWLSLPALYNGATIEILPFFEPKEVLAALQARRPTVACLVPTALQMLLTHPAADATDFSSLRKIYYAGSAIRPATIRMARAKLTADLVQFYGTSETYIITLLRPEQHDPARPEILTSCGSPMPLVALRLVDPSGRDVPEGEVGEVLVRSPVMFSGYWNAPEATAAAYADGWYHTGDLGRRDADGNYHLVDRAKDMIVTGGENVYSVEVETALSQHPAVEMVAVVGAADETWGERITAFVVPRAGSALTAEALAAHCRTLIAGYKVPKQINFVSALPLTPSGKIRKNVLRASLMEAAQSKVQ
jgi:acyl-CoA synthetase (AMP-forming)/AMP-acid ligase II